MVAGTIAKILTIAGSDSGGGAGIEADLKTISALGGYGCTAITALTAQNTTGVFGIHALPGAFVKLCIETVLADIGVDAVKIGMLGNAEIVRAVAGALPKTVPVVLDPVMVATSGAFLLEADAVAALRQELLPQAAVVTPNLPETKALTGFLPHTENEFVTAGRAIMALGAKAVLVKGGHGVGEMITDVLVHEGGVEKITHPRIFSRNTHGTGCTLASAIATGLAQGMTLPDAVRRACAYLQRAIEAAPGFGQGHGPVWHGVGVES